jgi:sarcosine oxidase subunit gamma
MHEAVSALDGATVSGRVTVSDGGLRGMVTLRGDLASPAVAAALQAVAGMAMPGLRRVVLNGDRGALWMSPDEVMILLPHRDADAMATALTAALAGTHHLAVNVSDARAVLRLTGPDDALRETLAKLAPVDMDLFAVGDIRRTRLGQVACAFWMTDSGTVELICFRSAARYVFDLLSVTVAEGGAVGHFG